MEGAAMDSRTLPGFFENAEELCSDGFGPVFRATRKGERFVVRLVRETFSREVAERLARPAHPAVLPVEVGPVPGGSYLAAPERGELLYSLVKGLSPGAHTPLSLAMDGERAVPCALRLVEAASSCAASGMRLGPLTWKSVLFGPDGVFVFPLGFLSQRSCDWLAHSPEDLLFVDRGTLRECPGEDADVFSIGAVLLAASFSLSSSEGGERDSRSFIRSVVVSGHPLSRFEIPDVSLKPALALALARQPASFPVFAAELHRIRDEHEPLGKALNLIERNEGLVALAVLHRAVQEGDRSLSVLLLKAQTEDALGYGPRARRTRQMALEAHPEASGVLFPLSRQVSDPQEAVRLLGVALKRDPLIADGWLQLGGVLGKLERVPEAIQAFGKARQIAMADPSQSASGLAASVALSESLLEAGAIPPALFMAEVPEWDAGEESSELLSEREVLKGRAHYQLENYERAISCFQSAVAREEKSRREGPRPGVLNHLAHALVAAGKRKEARDVVARSLEADPNQANLWRFLAALSEGEG